MLVAPGVAGAQPAWQTYCTPTDSGLKELSGMGMLDDALFAIGDSGTDEQMARLDRDCVVTDWLTVPVDPYDIEDLAIHDGSIWLSDTGDNRRARDTVALTRVDPADGAGELHRLTFPDGRHDVEALVVEPGGRPVLVTKEFSAAAGIYAPDMAVDALPSPGPTPLRRVGEIALGGVSSSGVAVPGAAVTGAALSLAGDVVALRTYSTAYLFPVRDGDVVAALTTQAPVEVRIPDPAAGGVVGVHARGRSARRVRVGRRDDAAADPRAAERGRSGRYAGADPHGLRRREPGRPRLRGHQVVAGRSGDRRARGVWAVTVQASRSCSTRSATLSRVAWSSLSTVTSVPTVAPRVMIIRAEPASTGSPPATASVTGTPASDNGLGDDGGGPGVQADGRTYLDGLAGHGFSFCVGLIDDDRVRRSREQPNPRIPRPST